MISTYPFKFHFKTPALTLGLAFLLISFTANAASPAFHHEVCRYEGDTDYSGHARIETRYDRSGDQITFRTLLNFTATYLLIFNVSYQIDEIDQMSAADGKLRSVGFNTRYKVGDSIKKQIWDRFNFDWSAHQTQGYRIQGKTIEDVTKQSPGFAGHWDPSKFGDDWYDSYSSSSPERRPDLDLKGFSDQVASPIQVALFSLRFSEPSAGTKEFEPFIPGSKSGKPQPPMRAIPAAGADGVSWKTHLVFGNMKSPADRPAEVRVREADHSLQSIHLVLEAEMGTAEGTLHLSGCESQ